MRKSNLFSFLELVTIAGASFLPINACDNQSNYPNNSAIQSQAKEEQVIKIPLKLPLPNNIAGENYPSNKIPRLSSTRKSEKGDLRVLYTNALESEPRTIIEQTITPPYQVKEIYKTSQGATLESFVGNSNLIISENKGDHFEVFKYSPKTNVKIPLLETSPGSKEAVSILGTTGDKLVVQYFRPGPLLPQYGVINISQVEDIPLSTKDVQWHPLREDRTTGNKTIDSTRKALQDSMELYLKHQGEYGRTPQNPSSPLNNSGYFPVNSQGEIYLVPERREKK